MDQYIFAIAGTTCPPESDREFNKWYDELHIPIIMKFKGVMEPTRYKLVRFAETAGVKEYPLYIATYKLKDMETFKKWNAGPELAEACKGMAELFARLHVTVPWLVQYESIFTRGKINPMSAINIVGTDCSPEGEAKFNRWYNEKHIPDLMKFKGLDGVARYRLAGSIGPDAKAQYPKYLAFYHFKDSATADAYDASPERAASAVDVKQMKTEVNLVISWRAQYTPMRTWQR